jgi:hypothetical protein
MRIAMPGRKSAVVAINLLRIGKKSRNSVLVGGKRYEELG